MNNEIDLTMFGEHGEPLDTPEKVVNHLHDQINTLGDFLLANYDTRICGSAVDTAIAVMREQEQRIKSLQREQHKLATAMQQSTANTGIERKPTIRKINIISERANRFKQSAASKKPKEESDHDRYDRAMGIV